jgi:hypothetical protein
MPLINTNPHYLPTVPNVTQEELLKIKTYATDGKENNVEACGVILKNKEVSSLRNTHPVPQDSFRITLTDFKKEDILLFWHSHFKDSHQGSFTSSDLSVSNYLKLPSLLYHAHEDFSCWDYYEPLNPNPYPLIPIIFNPQEIEFYLGWQFQWGRTDCFALIRRYFLGTLNIEIGEWKRPNTPPTDDPNWSFEDHWDFTQKFEKLPLHSSQFKKNDIFGIALRGGKKANHLAVLVNPERNLILHSPGVRQKSRLDVFDENWRSLIVEHGRLK